MALTLSAPTAALVNHGNALMMEFQKQGVSLHNLTFKEKEVAEKIENMIARFENHEVMTKPQGTIEVLKDIENSYNELKNNINGIEAKEKEISSLIQSIMNHQQGDNVQIGKINTEITNVQAILNSTQEQIRVTQNELDRLRNELQKLRRDVEEAEKRVKKKRKRKNRWILGAILTAGLLSSVAIGANKALHGAKQNVRNREAMLRDAESRYNNLQATLNDNNAKKAQLTTELTQRQHDLNKLGELLNLLRPTQQDNVKYREYLLRLSDAFNQLNSYAQNLQKNLNIVVETEAAKVAPDEAMKKTVEVSCKNLKDAWFQTKSNPVIQKTINLTDRDNVSATLLVIKSGSARKRREIRLADNYSVEKNVQGIHESPQFFELRYDNHNTHMREP